MKKIISVLTACSLLTSAAALMPAAGADYYIHTDFEQDLDGWGARMSESVEVTSSAKYAGTKCAAISKRDEAWNGIARSLDSTVFKPGKAYSFSAMVMQSSTPAAVHFKLSLQYTPEGDGGGMFGGGGAKYLSIAESDVISGTWKQLSNKSFTIPEGATNLILYIETEESKCDFFVDDIYVADDGVEIDSSHGNDGGDGNDSHKTTVIGDVDSNGTAENKDASVLLKYLLSEDVAINGEASDLDGNGKINAVDLSLLKNRLLNPQLYTTTTTTTTTVSTTTTTTTSDGGHGGSRLSLKENVTKVQGEMNATPSVPNNVKNGDNGTTTHFTYSSKKAGHNKGANVWLPPGYSESKQYPVLYMGHGIFGDEGSMLTGFSVREMASNLIQSGEAEPFIIIFTQMYTDPAKDTPGGFNMTQETMDRYDDYLYDLTESLMPYVESHWSVKSGKENTAIAGFSMGGREALYCTLLRPDVFGYCAASSPAPGIFPCVDSYLNHRGSYDLNGQVMSKASFKFSDDNAPYLLMIGGGTSDMVVGTFPKEYHQAFDATNTPNVWLEVQGGGHDQSVGTPLFYHYFRNLFK